MQEKRTVERYMTRCVHSIGREQTLRTAHAAMREYKIRHLPVLEGGKLVGLVSLRDVMLVEGMPDVDPMRVTVQEAMTQAPYTVGPSTDLAEVAKEMAKRKLGSVVVVHLAKVVGVFTTVDALHALSDTLSELEAAHDAKQRASASSAA